MKALEEQIELAIIKVEKNHRNPTMEQVSTEIEKMNMLPELIEKQETLKTI